MTDAATDATETPAGPIRFYRRGLGYLAGTAIVLAPPVLRIALAVAFFKSGLTKWDGFFSRGANG